MPHLSVRGPLLELNTKLIEALAGLVNVINRKRDVAEPTAWLAIAVRVALEVGVRFGAVVVGQFKDTYEPECEERQV